MTTPTQQLLPTFTDETIINLPDRFPQRTRNAFFRDDDNRNPYEEVWNLNTHLRSKREDKAGAISEFYINTLPTSADEMWRSWSANPVRTAHLRYTATYIAHKIRTQQNLPVLPGTTPEGMGLIVSAHFLIDRSYRGFGWERSLLDHINSYRNYKGVARARFATTQEDEELGADLIITEQTEDPTRDDLYGVQVKPVSFLRGTTNNRLTIDREDLFARVRQTEQNGLKILWHIIPNKGYSYTYTDSPLLISTEEAWSKVPKRYS